MTNADRNIIRGAKIENSPVGIRSDGPVEALIENVQMKNVDRPFVMGAGSSVEVRDTSVEDHQPEPSRSWGGTYRKASSIRKPRMPLPIFCPSCKTVSFSRKYNFEGCYFYSFGNTETCPSCGQQAELSEGVFNLTGDVLEIVSAPNVTHAMHAALRSILEAIDDGALTPEAAIDEVAKVSPPLAASLKAALAVGATVLGLMFAGLSCYYAGVQARNAQAQTEIQQQTLDLAKATAKADPMDGVRRARALEALLSENAALREKLTRQNARDDQSPVGDGGAPTDQKTQGPATSSDIADK